MTREEIAREREASLARRKRDAAKSGPSRLERAILRERFGYRDFGYIPQRKDTEDDYVPPADLTAVPKRGKRRTR